MRKRSLLIIVVVGLILLLATTVQTYRSAWAVDSSVIAARRNTGGAGLLSWDPIWVTPLKTTVADTTTGLVAALLRQSLSNIGLEGLAAPQKVPSSAPRTEPVALFLSVNKWEVKRTLTGWSATATATTEGIPLGDTTEGVQMEISSNISAAGKYTGWVRRSTVERHLAEQLVQKITEGIHNDLGKAGLQLTSHNKPAKKQGLGFSFSFSSFRVTRSGEQLVQGVNHPLLLPNAKVDYYWDLPHQTVLAYRVTISGTELESKLLETLGDRTAPHESFVDSVNTRRRMFSPNISHWVPSSADDRYGRTDGISLDTVLERQVLVIITK